MNIGDYIRWKTPSGKTNEGRILRVPSAFGPWGKNDTSLMVVRDMNGVVYQFNAWLFEWEIIQDNPGNN